MPSFTQTTQEYSPLLRYTGSWKTATSGSDPFLSSYSASSFVSTQSDGSSMSFTFHGTGVQVFGAKRGNHGLYQVTVDDDIFPAASGSVTPDQFQVALFSTNSLKLGLHTVTVTNQEDKFLDIDHVSWQNNIGETDENLIINTVDDSSNDFQFAPPSAWSSTPTNVGAFLGGTGHETASPGASMTYTFTGDSVALFGPLGPKYSPFTVQIDGGAVGNYSANNAVVSLPQVMLYYADGLGPGQHTLKLVYQPSQAGQLLAIDYATTATTASLGGAPLLMSTSSGRGLSGGQIAGVVIGLLLCLGLVFGGLWYFFVYSRRKHPSYGGKRLESSFLGSDNQTYSDGYIAQPGQVYSMGQAPRPASYLIDSPGVNGVPPLPLHADIPSAGTTSAYSFGEENHSPSSHSSHTNLLPSRGNSISSNSTSPRGDSTGHFITKGRRPVLPPSAGQSTDLPPEQLAATRMVVAGRPQDFGAIDPNTYTSVEEQREHNPPPNYIQATETF